MHRKFLADFCHGDRKNWLKTANISKMPENEKRELLSQTPLYP